MQWQARVRQALKRKDIEMALLEFSHQQKQKPDQNKDQLLLERKSTKRSKVKSKNEQDGISPGSSEGDSEDDNNEM